MPQGYEREREKARVRGKMWEKSYLSRSTEFQLSGSGTNDLVHPIALCHSPKSPPGEAQQTALRAVGYGKSACGLVNRLLSYPSLTQTHH